MPQAPSPAPTGAAQPSTVDQAFEAAHRAALADRRVQFDFPRHVPQPPPKTPGWLKGLGDLYQALEPILEVVFWGAVALGVAFIVYLILREAGVVKWRWRPKKPLVIAETYQPDAATASALLADADALAAQGRFAEAVHSLLLRSIEDMRVRRPRSVRPALTSRDIAALSVLPAQARPAFAAMAEAVERSLFGGRPVDRSDFDACRAAYEDFAFPKAWS